ncbi:MAG TPA: hypothetical protein VJT73_18230 [Polyangiaceae bacterium]|nr:hypothetical protein [Polyangiaceae bacterium]
MKTRAPGAPTSRPFAPAVVRAAALLVAMDAPARGSPPPEGEAGSTDATAGHWETPHYDRGFVVVSTTDSTRMPFRLKINHVSQFRYTNTLAVHDTYTDHLGREIGVNRRNDIQLTRDVFYFSGFAFDPRLDFNILLYTSSATLSATAAGYVGFVFDKAFALRAGFFSLPSVRSLTGTYPFFHGVDRSMANNYVRPGFTQGVWADGEPFPGWHYIAMIGNSLNTLDIAATKIDHNFAYSGNIWHDHNDFGKAWNDFEYHAEPALRVGTSFTFAREDRLSDLAEASPENNSIFISDGTLLFETGALAPNVTVELANYYLWAVDAGIKYRGLSFNLEVYQRWLNHFAANGPLPLSSMYDWGFEASLGYFALRSRLETYVRTSLIHGPFQTAVEGAPGFNWYPFDTRNVWLSSELVLISGSPYQSVLYVYSSGQTGLLVPVQFLLRF